MNPAAYHRERRRLAERLRTLREAAGLSGNRLAQHLGWVQSKVSKIETAKQLPTPDDLRQWVEAVAASPEALRELLALLELARTEYAAVQQRFRVVGGGAGLQAELLGLEAQSTRIALFQPAMIPGLLQTAEYARELLHLPGGPAFHGASEDDITRIVTVRMQRQQVLYDPGKRVQAVVLEAALRTRVCSAGTLRGQLDRLLALIGLPSLEVGIIPFSVQLPVYPLSGFEIYDRELALVETAVGESQLIEPEDVEQFGALFEMLREVASFGPEATAIIHAVILDDS